MCIDSFAAALSFVGGNVSEIILGMFQSVISYKIKNEIQKKSNQSPVYDYVEEIVGASSRTILICSRMMLTVQ